MSNIPLPPPDLPEVSGNIAPVRTQGKRQNVPPNYNNNNGLSPNKSSETDSSSNTSSKHATPSHPTTQTDRSVVSEQSPTSKHVRQAPSQPADTAGPAGEKVWERCWSLAELKQGGNTWTLASDAGLLKYLQDFSQRVTSRTHEISSQVYGLSLESQSSCGRLENVSNKFHKLSMEQFVENRVFDEDETEHTKEEAHTSEASPSQEDKEGADTPADGEVFGRANQAVKMGIDILDDAFDEVDLTMESDSDSSGDEGAMGRSTILPTELEPKDLYLLRPLPSLIGSATFYETDHLGLRLDESSDSEYGSEMFESEGESSGTETEMRQKQKQRSKRPGGLAEDMGDSSGDLFSEDEAVKQRGKGKRELQEGESPPLEEGSDLFNTKQGKFSHLNRNKGEDGGNLFGSSSDEGDLFSREPKKKKEEPKQPDKPDTVETTEPVTAPASTTGTGEQKKEKKKKKKPFAGAVPVFGILDSDSDVDDESEGDKRSDKFSASIASTVSISSKDTLFGEDSDSDGDLFSSTKPVSKPKEAKDSKADKETKQVRTPAPTVDVPTESPKDKTRFGGDSLNFDDSGSDEDLFDTSKKTKINIVSKKPAGAVKIFAGLDQDALLSKTKFNSTERQETNSPNISVRSADSDGIGKTEKKPTPTSKGMSLYEDTDSDDDLFSSMSQAKDTSKLVVKKEEPNKTITTNNNISGISKQKPEGNSVPVSSKSKLISNGLNFLNNSDDDSGDDLFSKPISVKSEVKESPEPVKLSNSPVVKPAPVVETTDDLFSGIATEGKKKVDLNTESNITAPVTSAKKEEDSSLFPLGGSDSDEDLFSLTTNKTVKKPAEKVSTQQKSNPPDPLQNKSGLFSEKDELFSVIQPTPDTSLAPTPSLSPTLPEPESKEDDLFSTPASLNLFAATESYETNTTPNTAPKLAKTTLPTLFAPIDTGTTSEGSLFDQPTAPLEDHVPPPIEPPLQQDDTFLPPITKSRPKNPGRHEPLGAASIEPLGASPNNTYTDNHEDLTTKPKTSVGKNKDFLKELNKAMGKGFAPGDPMPKKKPAAAFEDDGELFSNTSPKGAQKGGPMWSEGGAARIEGLLAPEEPAKLVGLSRSRPKGPAKRPQSRDARKKTIQTTTEDFGNFFSEPVHIPNSDALNTGGKLFNGVIEDELFGPSTFKNPSQRKNFLEDDFLTEGKTGIEDDPFLFGNPNKSKLLADNVVEDELFPSNSHAPPVKFHSTRAQPEEQTASVLAEEGKKTSDNVSTKTSNISKENVPPPLDLPEDLFASVALPKVTKSSKSGNKQKTAPTATPDPLQVEQEPTDINFEENSIPQEKTKKSHKVVKRTDEELFGGDDLFDAIPESKPKSKGDKPKKKRTTDASKKTKRTKKEVDPSSVDDIFD